MLLLCGSFLKADKVTKCYMTEVTKCYMTEVSWRYTSHSGQEFPVILRAYAAQGRRGREKRKPYLGEKQPRILHRSWQDGPTPEACSPGVKKDYSRRCPQ